MLAALKEVTIASKTICLYALGGKFKPLCALSAALLISASAALFEELAFRGVIQTLMSRAFGHLLPRKAAVALGLLGQA